MTEPILRLDSLDKRFGDAVAARDFSLDVHAGEFFTFLGPSGSGKSSVLRMIADGTIEATQVCKGGPWAIPEAQVDALRGTDLRRARPRTADPNQAQLDFQ